MPHIEDDFLSKKEIKKLGFLSHGNKILIHRTAVIVNCDKISLGSEIKIGPFSIISAQSSMHIGNNVRIGSAVTLAGSREIHLDDFVVISDGARILSATEDHTGRTLTNPTVPEQFKAVTATSIRFGAYSGVGTGSVVLPGADFPEGAWLDALSYTNAPLKAWSVYAGIPARHLYDRVRDLSAFL